MKSTQAEDRRKKLARIERVEPPREITAPAMAFPPAERSGDVVLRAEGLAKSFDRPLFEHAFSIPPKHLVRDGAAKSVLPDAMRGIVPDPILDSRRKVGFNAPVYDFLDPDDPAVRAEILRPSPIFDVVRKQNAIVASGTVETKGERVAVRVDGAPTSATDLALLPFSANGQTFTLADIADIKRGYQDRPQSTMRFKGKPVIGLGVVMAAGGNVQALGKALDATMQQVERDLPVGITVHRVANQPEVVESSFEEFIQSLGEALAIVLVVSFISLGVRTGVIVALSVPLVLAITFVGMMLLGIDFQRISLGALIIALGLLVDDAIIAVEMMMVKLEQGFSRMEAATYAYTSTAFPMLTGTLVTAAGFVPVGFAKSSAGEYTNSIFWVVGMSLVISWFVAVLFTPWLGYHLLPTPKTVHHDAYDGRLYRLFRRLVVWCVSWRKTTIAITALCFVAAMAAFGLVQKQFFPVANRPELIVDLRLAQGASYAATDAEVRKLEKWLGENRDVAHYTAYVGAGSPRFYLPTVPELTNANFGQVIVMTKGLEARERVFSDLNRLFNDDFEAVRARVALASSGVRWASSLTGRSTTKFSTL